jgi:hypothetical protein
MPHLSDHDGTPKLPRLPRSRSWGNYSPHVLANRCSSPWRSDSPSDSKDTFSDARSSEPATPGVDAATLLTLLFPAQTAQREVPVLLGNPCDHHMLRARESGERDTRNHAGKTTAAAQPKEAASESKDEVTSMMIRNIPYSLTQQKLIDALDATGFTGLYDFCYLPHKFSDHKNVGYAFVNFLNSKVAQDFQRVWHQDKGTVFNASDMRKALNITEAVLQGLQANMQKAKSKKMGRVKNTSFKRVLLNNSLTDKCQSHRRFLSFSCDASMEYIKREPRACASFASLC